MWTNPINKPNPHLAPPPTPTHTQRLEYVADATRNPLYRATEAVDPIFQESPLEVKTNGNQCQKYVDPARPFIRVY